MYHPFKFPLMFASWLSPWLAFALLVAAPATQAGEPALQRIRMATVTTTDFSLNHWHVLIKGVVHDTITTSHGKELC